MINSVFGTSMALISALSWAGCAVLFKKWGKNYQPEHINLFNTTLSFFWLCILVILTHSSIIISKESLVIIMISGLIGVVIADSIYYSALRLLSPVTLTIASLIGSVFSGFWGYYLYGEVLNKISAIGIFFVLMGVGIIYSTYPKNNILLKFKIFGLFLAIISSFLTTFAVAIIKSVISQPKTSSIMLILTI